MRNAASLLPAALLAALLLCTPAAFAAQGTTPKAAPKAKDAGQVCIGFINRTPNTIRVESKTGSLTFLEVAPHTIDSFCCPTHEKLCFDKGDGSTKIKIARLDPASPDEWSGSTCRKLYLKPGSATSVRMDLDGSHIVCEPAKPADYARPFEQLDLDKSGGISEAEAASNRISPSTFKAMDQNGDGTVDQDEYKSAFDRINVLKGVPF